MDKIETRRVLIYASAKVPIEIQEDDLYKYINEHPDIIEIDDVELSLDFVS